jgi:predicted ATPase
LEKARIVRIECRVQDLLYSWHVDFGVFDGRMISMHQHGGKSQQQKKSKFFDRRVVFQITNL